MSRPLPASLNLRASTLVVLGATALLLAGCATRESAQRQSAETLATIGSEPHRAASTELKALTAAGWGDTYTAANLFERAEAKQDSPLNRFNLAAAYQKTGRTREAARLYHSVTLDGGNSWAYSAPDNDNRSERVRHFNLADESRVRLVAIQQGEAAQVDLDAKKALAAAGQAAPGPNAGKVSDAHAEKLDQTVQAAPKP